MAGVATIPNLGAWAEAIVDLPVSQPLPSRLILVPDEDHAHALRVELVQRAPHALLGTRFLTAAAAARMVLASASITYRVGEEERRRLRLRRLFRDGLSLATFRDVDLRSLGWPAAFAESIGQLEGAGLVPEDMEQLTDPRALDVATVWRMLDEAAGISWTVHRILREATAVLAATPSAWPIDAPVLALVPSMFDAVHVRFLRAIPRLTLGVGPRRPFRRRYRERVCSLFGTEVGVCLDAADQDGGLSERRDELAILAAYVFDAPERLGAPTRARSTGPDGTVSLEAYAGVDEEVDAAVRWVADEVQRGTRLQAMAILVPRPEPLGLLVAQRIAALPWPEAARQPVYLACGRPATSTAAGARMLALIRAVAAYLPAEALVELLPRLRLEGADGHLSPRRAREVVRTLATLGGSAARPRDALVWSERLRRLDLDPRVRGIAPALDALVGLVEHVLAGEQLGALWRAIRAFTYSYVIMPGDPETVLEPLHAEMTALADDAVTDGVIGVEAVELVAERLEALRLYEGRFGDPSVYVGTIEGAAGLSFTSVRVLGLAESVFPGTLRADPLLPGGVRERLSRYAMATDDDYATSRLQALHQIIRNVRERLVLSVSHSDVDGSEREPSAMFVEVAVALGRPNATSGEPARIVPTALELERDGFAPARAMQQAARASSPLLPSCWQDAVAARAAEIPSEWQRRAVTDPREVDARAARMHGLLGDASLARSVPGLAVDRATSANVLLDLLACPQRFLLRHVLAFRPRVELASPHQIEAQAYGSIVHRIVEIFLRAHGLAFGAKERDLAYWNGIADEIACAQFEELLGVYPLAEAAVETELRRLRHDVRMFVEDDWMGAGARELVDVERPFGEPQHGVPLATAHGPLYVTGRIDRIDREGGLVLVRDLKTGRAKPRERELAEPDVATDLQLAVYAAITEALADEWGLTGDVAVAYMYLDRFSPVRERTFREDRHVLRAAGQAWLDIACALLREHAFVRTPDRRACRWCSFAPVCGDAGTSVSGSESGAVSRYLELHE